MAVPLGDLAAGPLAADASSTSALKPWKHVGYRGFCDFLISDNDFLVFRRFSGLATRVLLGLQDELTILEESLEKLELQLSLPSAQDRHNGTFREDHSKARCDHIREIEGKIRNYYTLAQQHSDFVSRPKVPERNATSITNWFYNYGNAIHAKETDFVEHTRDLFAAVPKIKTPLRLALECFGGFRLCCLWRKPAKIQDANIHYASDTKIDSAVTVVIMIIGVTMLVSPLWTLAYVSDKEKRLGVITTFLVLFLSFVSFSTVARPFETLGSAAAYAAVLVVFLQITP